MCSLLRHLLLVFATLAHSAGMPACIRLYMLDCGRLDINIMRMFNYSGALGATYGQMSLPCFLDIHADGALLWGTGLGEAVVNQPGGTVLAPGIRATVPVKPVNQLATFGLNPIDIDCLTFSLIGGTFIEMLNVVRK